MSRLRLLFILSLLILLGIFISIIVSIPQDERYTESKRVQIIAGENEWILQCDITNDNERDTEYIIHVTVDDAVRRDSVTIAPGRTYTYIQHIYPQTLDEGKITFTLYEEGKEEPVEQATYYINGD